MPGKSPFSAVPDPSFPLWSGIFRVYRIPVQVNDPSADTYFCLMDNLKIVWYEGNPNFETTENVYYPSSILKTLFAGSLRCWHLFDGSATGSNPPDIVVSCLSSCSLLVFVCKPVCVHTWKYQHVWCCTSRNIIHSVTYLRSCCKWCVKNPLDKYILCHKTLITCKSRCWCFRNTHTHTQSVADCRNLECVCVSCSSSFNIWLFVQGQRVAAAYLYIDKIGSV